MKPQTQPGQTPEPDKTPENNPPQQPPEPDKTPENNPPQQPPAPEIPDWVKDPGKAYEEIQKLRVEAAERRAKLKTWEDEQQQREREAAKKTEAQLAEQNNFKALAEKLQADRDQLQAQLEAMTQATLRQKVAAEFQLPAAIADRLQGKTEDEMRADAQTLKAALPAVTPQPGRPGGTTTPVPGGPPGKETNEQKRKRIFGSGTHTFGSK